MRISNFTAFAALLFIQNVLAQDVVIDKDIMKDAF